MGVAAAYRQIRPIRRYTANRANRRSAVNTGFHGYFLCDLHRSVRIKDDVKIDPLLGYGDIPFRYLAYKQGVSRLKKSGEAPVSSIIEAVCENHRSSQKMYGFYGYCGSAILLTPT